MNDPAAILYVIAPELQACDVSGALSLADMQIAPNLCGDKRPMLVAYLAAHILTLGLRAGRSGAVTAVTEGQLSESYGAVQGIMGGLAATSYGVEYDRLSRGCTFAARTRVNYAV